MSIEKKKRNRGMEDEKKKGKEKRMTATEVKNTFVKQRKKRTWFGQNKKKKKE